MDTATTRALRALRKHEFNHVLTGWRHIQSPLVNTPFDRVLLLLLYCLGGLATLFMVSMFRAEMIHHLTRHTHALNLIIWVLWGLGGLVAVAGGVWAGFASETLGGKRFVLPGKPFVWLLPLTERQVRLAKLQGRGAALIVFLVVGAWFLEMARVLMQGILGINDVPPLLDPWLGAAVLFFFALFIASTQLTTISRRAGMRYAAGLGLLYFAGCYAVGFGGQANGLWVYGPENIVVFAGLVLLHVMLVTVAWKLVLAASGPARARAAAGTAAAPRTPRETRALPVGDLSPLLFQVTRSSQWPGRLARMFLGCLVIGVIVAASTIFFQLITVVAFALYAATHAADAPLSAADTLLFFSKLPSLSFALGIGLALPAMAWPEQLFGASRANVAFVRQTAFMTLIHEGYLLPVAARRLWTQRLTWLLVMNLFLLPVGLLCQMLVSRFGLLVGWLPPSVGPTASQALAICVISVAAFAYGPLLRQMSRHLLMSGCLLMALMYFGTIGVLVPLVERLSRYNHLPPWPAFVWLLLMVFFSWVLTEPRAWPRTPTGARSLRGLLQALACLVSLPMSAAAVIGVLIVCLHAAL